MVLAQDFVEARLPTSLFNARSRLTCSSGPQLIACHTIRLMAINRSRRARAARRRKRRMDRVEHDLTAEQWAALMEAWGGACAYCNSTDESLQRDCVLALSRGGRYTLDNIVPACRSCNASKCNQEVTGWLRRRRLDERAFLLRHVEVSAALALRFSTEVSTADP
jgi:5-methylcytosine-specific restriction endonuclease McrA